MNRIRKIIVEVSRVLLGITFSFSGFVKAADPMGSAIKIGEYFTAFKMSVPESVCMTLSILLCIFEFMIGATALMGIFRKLCSRVTLAVMIFMTILTFYLAIANPVADCGCFGDAIKLTNWETFGKNIVLLAASVIFIKNFRSVGRLFSFNSAWLPAMIAFAGITIFTISNILYLPAIDFRPFKVGKRLEAIVSIPEDEEPDKYEYLFTYRKGEEVRDFDMNNLPDSTWTFVDRKEKLVKKGYTPPVPDFAVFDQNGEDLTPEIIEEAKNGRNNNHKGIILMIAPKLEKADDGKADVFGEIYDYSKKQGIPFYALSGSSEKAVKEWKDNTGADYPIYISDATILKTIARSNPSIMFVKDGIITGKYSFRGLPNMDRTPAFIDKNLPKEVKDVRPSVHWTRYILLASWAVLLIFVFVRRIIRRTSISFKLNSNRNKQINTTK